MSYTKTAWVNDTSQAINAANLNKIEAELAKLDINQDVLSNVISILNNTIGLPDQFTISGALINSSGVIESVNNYDMYCVEVVPGTQISINVSPSTSFAFGFFTSKPAIGSTSYNGGRIVEWSSSKSNILVPGTASWVAIRVAVNQIPTVTVPYSSGLAEDVSNSIKRTTHDFSSSFDADNGVINTYLYIPSSNTGANYHLPADSGVGYLFTIGNNENVKEQIYIDVANKNVYMRRYVTGWASWQNIATNAVSSAISTAMQDALKRVIPSSVIDADDADLNTYIYITSSNVGSTYHLPDGSGVGYLFTIGNGDASKGQIYVETRRNKIYFRTHITSWGNWLNVLDDTLKNGGTITGTFDFNDAVNNTWNGILSNSCTNSPVDGQTFGMLFTYQWTSTVKGQIFITNNSGKVFARLWSSNQWSSWVSSGGGGNGFNYEKTVSTAADLYNELANMPLYSHIIVEPGDYDISQYIEANGEIQFKRGCWLEGREKANIICNLTEPSETTSIFLMGRGWEKISGVTLTGSYLRYLIHDEMGGGNAAFFEHEYVDIDFRYTSEKFETIYDICRSFGCGLGNNGRILIENCTFEDTNESCINIHSNSVVYHPEQPQPFAPTRVYVKDCYSDTSTLVYYTVTGDTGAVKNPMYVCNNAFNGEVRTTGAIAFDTKTWNNADLSE